MTREEEEIRGTIIVDATTGIATPILDALEVTTIDTVEIDETTNEGRINCGGEIARTKVGREGERNSEIGTSARRIEAATVIRVVRRESSDATSGGGVGVASGDSTL